MKNLIKQLYLHVNASYLDITWLKTNSLISKCPAPVFSMVTVSAEPPPWMFVYLIGGRIIYHQLKTCILVSN